MFKIHRVLTTMLKDRGYDVSGENVMSKSEFDSKYPNLDSMNAIIYTGKDTLVVNYIQDSNKGGSIGIGPINVMFHYMKENDFRHGLIVLKDKLSSRAKEEIENAKNDVRIEVFQEADLMFPCVYHRLVPKHVPLSEKDADEVLKKLKLDRNKIPRLPTFDAVARYYDFSVGTLIAIYRENGIYYRIVTD